MKARSPAVRRITSILNFFAEHPRQAYTLTQITNSLRMNSSTCFATLMDLAEEGYLYRNPDKSYVVGPALLALANSAQQHFSPLDVARQEMRALADDLDVITAALFLEKGELVVRERAAALKHLGSVPPPGQRYPLYPWGSVFMMPLPDAAIEAWMGEARPPLSEDDRRETLQQIQFCRGHGYLFVVNRPNRNGAVDAESIYGAGARHAPTLEPDQVYSLLSMTSPVMNGQGQVAFILSLHGFDRDYGTADVAAMGNRLREACGRITGFITGKKEPAGQ
jgi:DNA-binding IclR family transcriptional regulator